MPSSKQLDSAGPFYAHQVRVGDRYEVSEGHAVYCAPTGGDGARGTGAGFEVLDTDPAVESSGIDPGYSPEPKTLRAPDIAVGNVPDKPGWIPGAPPLAVEYASVGQDEQELQQKIGELLEAGTQLVWVVRLVGPRRVEQYAPGVPMRTLGPGEQLTAPGILRNAVPVEAMYDRTVAHELTLRNLLQRRGYETLDAVRQEGHEQGLAQAMVDVLRARGLTVEPSVQARILAERDPAVLSRWITAAVTTDSAASLLG
ncbi:MAG: Uma2 family endonuclease [Myxococcota bacterium]